MLTNEIDIINFEQPDPDVDRDHYGDTEKAVKTMDAIFYVI